ncbi:MAG: hypothetical protein JSW52_01420 [Candidatus Coatesbacteria bacterium]|nr:MAG: hypothetical protein JSW52_01420 [Candidatus Coatesbacteria bacterium]
MGNKLLFIDAMNLVFRAYFAFVKRPLRTTEGFNTGAIFGFVKMVRKALEEVEPTHVAVAFEGGLTFRNELYPEYKANRADAPDDLKAQVEPVKEVARAMGIPVLEVPGAEADDVIATLSKRAEGFDEVVILSGDKDLMQLVNDRVNVLAPKSGVSEIEELGPEQVREKMKVEPDQVRDLLALAGDSSDNVPGVPGVGNKTAANLLYILAGRATKKSGPGRRFWWLSGAAKCNKPPPRTEHQSVASFCRSWMISALVGSASTEPNFVQARAPAAEANLTASFISSLTAQ